LPEGPGAPRQRRIGGQTADRIGLPFLGQTAHALLPPILGQPDKVLGRTMQQTGRAEVTPSPLSVEHEHYLGRAQSLGEERPQNPARWFQMATGEVAHHIEIAGVADRCPLQRPKKRPDRHSGRGLRPDLPDHAGSDGTPHRHEHPQPRGKRRRRKIRRHPVRQDGVRRFGQGDGKKRLVHGEKNAREGFLPGDKDKGASGMAPRNRLFPERQQFA